MDDAASAADKRKLLAALLQRSQQPAGPELALTPQARPERLPLSYAQTRLWLLDQLEPASSIYTISTVLQLTGALRADVLEASINEIVRRHEALRTIFLHEQGQPYQVVLPYQPVRLPIVDLSAALSAAAGDPQDAVAAQLARLAAEQPFDLRKGPLFRVALLRKGELDHLLSLDLHHIISDAWSFKLFTQELAALYTSFSRGERSALPELPVQFPDYCLWERQWLRGDLIEKPLAYWKKQLAGKLPVIQLPADRARAPRQTHRGALHRFYLPSSLVDGVKAFSRQAGVTPFMTLVAAFQTLIYRYSGQEDMLVGTAFAGRNKREVHELIGFFVNTLPLRVSMAGQPSFAALLDRVRDAALGAYANQDLPFIRLVEELQPDRDTSYSPLVQIMFVMRQKAPAATYPLPALTMGRPREVDGGVAKFELSWSMEEEEGDFLSQIEYNADLFDAARVERLGGHFVTLLTAAIADPERSITTLPLLTEDEQRALRAWNPTPDRSPRRCFHRLFEANVANAPDQAAVVFGDEQLGYAELDARANRLARHLRSLGVGPDVLVGICLERSFSLVAAVLAVFKAGGAYVPIDPTLPPERIGFLLEDTRMPIVLVHHQTRALFRAPPAALSLVDVEAVPATGGPDNVMARDDSGSRLAYVIYTSGTTGRPKGVQVEHAGLHNLVQAQIATFGVTPESRVLQFASMSFDASIFEIVMALGAGATLVLAPHLTVGPRLVELLERQAVTHATLPPSVLANLPDAELPSLQAIISAGEPCPPAIVERWGASRGFFNAYGPTEATVWATVARCEVGKRVTIGKPIAGTQIHLLDRYLQPVPVGVPGEMYIGGIGLARGYLGRPELTRQAFIQDPFGPPGARLYRTGDLARYLEDGSIDFLGRTDDQVKLRGFRIELEEIELALRAHPAVREAAVIVKGEGLDDRQLVAFYVGTRAEITAAELRSFVKQKLPSYMVPSAFVAMAAFPLTSSNKIDRQALTTVEVVRHDEPGYRPPATALEEIIANVWAAVLQVERVGAHDDFFELGGHSLQAAQVASRVGDAISQRLPLSAVFERPTVAELARFIQDRHRDARQSPATPIRHLPDAERYRLSFAQQRLWLLDAMTPGRPEYNTPTVVELRGPLDRDALRASLRAIAERHETLRTRFVSEDGVPGQVVTARQLACSVIELGHLTRPQQDAEVARLALAEAQRPFDLASDLMIRATLLCRSADHHVLLLTIHHIAADDRSMRIILQDLDALYTAAVRGSSPALPALPIRYRDFAEWQRQWFTGERLEAQLAYWRQQLAGLPPPSAVPVDHARPAVRTDAGDSASRVLPSALVDALARLGRQESCTLFMTMLAALGTVLHRYTGEDDIVVGSPVADRGRRETENVVGFFGNTLVMRTDLSGRPSFRELLARVRKMALEAYEHADVPYEEVVDKLGLRRDATQPSLLRVMIAFQDTAPLPSRIGDVAVSVSETDNKTAKFDLVLFVRLVDGELVLRAQYDARLYRQDTIERMLGHLHSVLESAAGNPAQHLGALQLLSPAEERALRAWNDTATDYPEDTGIPPLFEAQAARTPDAIAVVWRDRQLTYRQLNQQANQLAHQLRRLGIGPDTPVGVYMERSPEMMVSILGVLKAGGAYVPLDPTYPDERIALMLSDAQISVVITHGQSAATPGPRAIRILDLEADQAALRLESQDNPAHRIAPDNLACVLYTSGSTGKPKGVQIPHRAINRLLFNTNYVQIAPADRVAQVCNASFDGALFEIWGALLHGARLNVIDKEVVISPQDLASQLQDHGITVMFLTTALFNVMANTALAGLCSVRDVLFGGEAADVRCIRDVIEHGKRGRLVHCYGPTEATTFATWYHVQEVPEEATTVPIGRPISNTQIYLLDAYLQPVPIGIPGEVYIGGPGLARGYLDRPELTAERFIRHPWSSEPGARLYKTGDLARYLPDGCIEFIGRRDHQVKLRGYRIELGEIEAALRTHPALTDAVVLVREEAPGDKRLVAYVVYEDAREDARDARAGELRQYLGERLPGFMVPSAFIAMDALPLSPNGKIDRKRLLEVRDVTPDREIEYVAPRSELERDISTAWQEVLHLEKVGIHDNFFDLGGSSLLVPQLLSKLNKRLEQKLAPITLFQYPSIAALAGFLSQEATPGPSFARTQETASTMRAARTRQAQRRKKLEP